MRIYFTGIGKNGVFYTDNNEYNRAIIDALRNIGHEVVVDPMDTDFISFLDSDAINDFEKKIRRMQCFCNGSKWC